MRIQIWSVYYEPEPMGIAPMAHSLAAGLVARGHQVEVITSHPHYPSPTWGRSFRPRRRRSDGVEILELPVYVRRDTPARRLLMELSYGISQTAAALKPRKADAVIAVLPSLMVVPGATMHARIYGVPLVVWIHDMVSALAGHSDLLGRGTGATVAGLERLEARAFRRADRIVTISDSFIDRLRARGVPAEKLARVYLPATSWPQEGAERPRQQGGDGEPVALAIGNIGLTQNLPALARAFSDSPELAELNAQMRVTGDGVDAPALAQVCADGNRVSMEGVVSATELEAELAGAAIGLISQHPDVLDFNLPSKLTTYLAHGLPVLAIVDPESEVAALVRNSGGGWVADSSDVEAACRQLAQLLADADQLAAASERGRAFARATLAPELMAERFESVLLDAGAQPSSPAASA